MCYSYNPLKLMPLVPILTDVMLWLFDNLQKKFKPICSVPPKLVLIMLYDHNNNLTNKYHMAYSGEKNRHT